MWRIHLAQWKPGDFFAIRPTGDGIPNPRFYREIPDPDDQEVHIPIQNVNLNLIYTVTAVCEEANWTAIKFQNRNAMIRVHEGPVESLWTIARNMDIPLCRHVRISNIRSGDYEHLIHHPHLHNRSRSRSR